MQHNDTAAQERQEEKWAERSGSRSRVGSDYSRSSKRESLFLDHEHQRRDPGLSTTHSPVLGRTSASFVTQVSFLVTSLTI